MWLIMNKENDQIYKIKTSRENTVSRKNGDLILCGDQSISRQHAVLKLSENGEKVILKDLGSKYGTSVKHKDSEFKKAKANEEIVLNVGDIIRFGIQSNLWKLEYFPIVVTASILGQEEKTELRQIISALDGTVVSNWSPQCTHLVMNQITVTVKVVCALAACRSIVTLAYFKTLHQCITTMQLPLPNVNDFVPELVEATLNPNEVSFIPNLQRKTLFSGTVFVASTLKQLARIEIMVTAAGGKVEEFVPTKAGIDKYLNKGYVLMMHSAIDKQSSQESQVPNGYINTAKILKNQGVRCIPESEIGLGILYCSMKQYCNPRFKIQIVAQQKDSCEQTKESSSILVPETQEKSHEISCSNMEIPETCSLSVNKAQSSSKNYKKRACDKELEETIIQKRACRQQNVDEDLFASQSSQLRTSCQISESGKRQASTARSADLFSFSIEKDASIAVDSSKEHSRSSDPFNFPSKNIDNVKACSSTSSLNNSSKRLNSSTDSFSSIVEKNKRRNSQDSDFTFPSEREENQSKIKRNREEDSEFDFLSEWEDKRPKLNSVVSNKKKNEKKNKSLFHNNDPFNFPMEKEESSKTNSEHGLWHSIVNEMRSEHSSKNQKTVQDKATDNLSSVDEINLPEVWEELKYPSFQVIFDEEVKKELPKPIPLSAFISKQTVKKEIIKAEEGEDLADQLNETCEIQVKSLVVVTTPPPQKSHSNILNFKKFKRKQPIVIPCIIGGSDLIPHEIY